MDPPSDGVVFTIGPAQYRLSDIVRAANHKDLADLEETVRQGIACVKQAAGTDTLPTDAEIEAAADEFRYHRDLITGDEMQAWLDRWGLTVEGWTEHLQRLLLRRRWAGELPDLASEQVLTQEEIAAAVYAEGICSGQYGRLAHKLAARLAAYERARHEGWLTADSTVAAAPADKSQLDAAIERLRAHAVTPAAVRAEVASRHLDWVRLDCDLVSFANLHRAREAALCVREDGRELAQVAADARSVLRRATLYLADVEPAWRNHLLGSRQGAVVGPLSGDGRFTVLLVHEKILPMAEDSDIRRRAEASLLDRALEYEISSRVTWHTRL